MALVTCEECKAEISDKAATCPKCGAPNSSQRAQAPIAPARSGIWKWVLGIPVALFGLVMLIGTIQGNNPDYQNRTRAKAAIDMCWASQARKSLDPGTAQFVAGACEKMEADFRLSFGRNP